MWTEVTPEDTELMERWCLIIRSVHPHYQGTDVNELFRCMDGTTGRIWYYDGGGFDIAMRFHHVPKRDEFQLASVGFLGQVEPRVIVDLLVEKCGEILAQQGRTHLFSLRPKQKNGTHMEAFFQMAPNHPGLAVEVVGEWRDVVMWKIVFRGLAAAAESSDAAKQAAEMNK